MKIGFLALVVLALAGCSTPQMKSTPFYSGGDTVYTGKAEDRVNLWPLAYYREPALSVLWPMFSVTDDHVAFRPFYTQVRQNGRGGDFDEFNFLWPYGQLDTLHGSGRVPPFFWDTDSWSVFPLYWHTSTSDMLFPLFGDFRGSKHTQWYLAGLAGYTSKSSEWKSWLFPLLYLDSDGDFLSPIGGRFGETAITPFWISGRTSDNSTEQIVPPLLSKFERYGNGSGTDRVLLCLYGTDYGSGGDVELNWLFPFYSYACKKGPNPLCLGGVKATANGNIYAGWLFPFYSYDTRNDLFVSLVYGHFGQRKTWWGCPLFGTNGGTHRSGVWAFPLVDVEFDDRTEGIEQILESPRLENAVSLSTNTFAVEESTWGLGLYRGQRTLSCHRGKALANAVREKAGTAWRDGGTNGTVQVSDIRSSRSVLYSAESTRTISFNVATGERLFDGSVSESEVLGGLVWRSNHEVIPGKGTKTSARLFGRAWQYEEDNGTVVADAFPFFTHDAKANGFYRTSFLWRFYRNEADPEKGRSVDLLFLPVWRSSWFK